MKIGDLVRLAPHCKNGGTLAIVTYVPPYRGEVKIKYLEPTQSTSADSSFALISNLILVSGT